MTDKEKIRKEVEKLKSSLIHGACSSQIAMETRCKEEAYNEILAILDSLQEEPVSEDLEEACEQLAENARKHKAETSSPFFSQTDYKQGVIDGAKWQQEKEYTCYEEAFEDGAKWKVENLWKPADGDDLPEIDREVIVLIEYNAQHNIHDKEYSTCSVGFAHRPSKYAKVWNSVLGEEQVVEIEGYDKGGWNIPNVKYWLDYNIDSIIKED